MSVKLFLKDNTNGRIHEYGANQHDSLILMEDGSLHYENLQNCTGTQFPEEGYSFVCEDGTDPRTNKEYVERGVEPYIDIGGEEDGRICEFCKHAGNIDGKCDLCKDNPKLTSHFIQAKSIFDILMEEKEKFNGKMEV